MVQNSVWNKLLEFESRDLIERYIKKKFERNASARQVLEISSNFIQGREYFKNAQHAAITVKPLLQFYGVSALARGLILAISPKLSESSLTPGHGLNVFKWRENLSKSDFSGLTVTISKGAFKDLLVATDNLSYLKHNTSAVNWQFPYSIPEDGKKFTFGDLVQTFPDFNSEYTTWTGEKFNVLQMQGFTMQKGGKFDYWVSSYENDEAVVESVFPKEKAGQVEIAPGELRRKHITTLDTYFPQVSQRFADPLNAGIAGLALTKPIPDGIRLNSITQFTAISYFLGMLCRYFPSVWISLGRTEKGDAVYPLMVKIMDTIEQHFPRLILEFLNGPYDKK